MALDLSKELPGILSSLLSSPEVLSKLLSTLSSSGEERRKDDAIEVAAEEKETPLRVEAEQATPSLPPAQDAVAASSGEGRGRRREGLLRALRPYLSPSRCERLDTLVRVSSMLDSIKGNF